MSPLRKIKVKSIKKNAGINRSGTWKGWFSLILFILLLVAIFFGGPASSRFVEELHRKDVDKNGAIVKAVVYQKVAKARRIYFQYFYNGIQYKAYEGASDLFENVSCGDIIVIKIDTLDPESAYIIELN